MTMGKCGEYSNSNKYYGVKDKSSIPQHPAVFRIPTLGMSAPHCTCSPPPTQRSSSLPLRLSLTRRLAFPRGANVSLYSTTPKTIREAAVICCEVLVRQKETMRVGGSSQGRRAGSQGSRDGFLEGSRALGREMEFVPQDVQGASMATTHLLLSLHPLDPDWRARALIPCRL